MQQWPCQVSPEKSPQLSPESRPSAPCWAAESPAAAGTAPAFERDNLPVDLKTYGSAECGCSVGLKHADASGRGEATCAAPACRSIRDSCRYCASSDSRAACAAGTPSAADRAASDGP